MRRSRFDFAEFKVHGTYYAPWLDGFTMGVVYRWRNGTRWHRLVRVRQPILTFLEGEEPHSRRTPSLHTLDLRVEKRLRIWRGAAGVYVDIFNATNVGRPLGVTALSGPSFGVPGLWTEPRTAQLGVRYGF